MQGDIKELFYIPSTRYIVKPFSIIPDFDHHVMHVSRSPEQCSAYTDMLPLISPHSIHSPEHATEIAILNKAQQVPQQSLPLLVVPPGSNAPYPYLDIVTRCLASFRSFPVCCLNLISVIVLVRITVLHNTNLGAGVLEWRA